MPTVRPSFRASFPALGGYTGLHSQRRTLTRAIVRGAGPDEIAPALDAYIARQAPERLGSKMYALRASLQRHGVPPTFLDDALQRGRMGTAAVAAQPPLDAPVVALTVPMVRQMCYDLAPIVRAQVGGWALRVDRLDVELVPNLAAMKPDHGPGSLMPAALFIPFRYNRGPRDLWRGRIVLSLEHMLQCTQRHMRGYLLHELVHAAQNQNHPEILRMRDAWEFTVLKEGHAHFLQRRYLGRYAPHAPTADHLIDPAVLPYWLGSQVYAALADRPDLTALLYKQPDLIQVALGRQRLADAAYYGRVRTPEEIRVFKQDLARVADEMGFTNAE
jgi:hypothetical protein